MAAIARFLTDEDLALIHHSELSWLEEIFELYQGYPRLADIWALMDDQWRALGCDPVDLDDRVTEFYRHPVWLLNGLFIEQDELSLAHRRVFADWAAAEQPKRVADLGGGFGTLARMIGEAGSNIEVEIIEPHPHAVAAGRVNHVSNVCYVEKMSGIYDIIIATDVFEHVPDPLSMVAESAEFLRTGGKYLIANCFYPEIHCHLPQLFHLRYSWQGAIVSMGLHEERKLRYGNVFQKKGDIQLHSARRLEAVSQKLWKYTRYLPARLARQITILIVHRYAHG